MSLFTGSATQANFSLVTTPLFVSCSGIVLSLMENIDWNGKWDFSSKKKKIWYFISRPIFSSPTPSCAFHLCDGPSVLCLLPSCLVVIPQAWPERLLRAASIGRALWHEACVGTSCLCSGRTKTHQSVGQLDNHLYRSSFKCFFNHTTNDAGMSFCPDSMFLLQFGQSVYDIATHQIHSMELLRKVSSLVYGL